MADHDDEHEDKIAGKMLEGYGLGEEKKKPDMIDPSKYGGTRYYGGSYGRAYGGGGRGYGGRRNDRDQSDLFNDDLSVINGGRSGYRAGDYSTPTARSGWTSGGTADLPYWIRTNVITIKSKAGDLKLKDGRVLLAPQDARVLSTYIILALGDLLEKSGGLLWSTKGLDMMKAAMAEALKTMFLKVDERTYPFEEADKVSPTYDDLSWEEAALVRIMTEGLELCDEHMAQAVVAWLRSEGLTLVKASEEAVPTPEDLGPEPPPVTVADINDELPPWLDVDDDPTAEVRVIEHEDKEGQ